MVSLPVDVVRYLVQRFAERDLPGALDLLDTPCLNCPRVLRAVVYLSNGSLSMLEHYVSACEADAREVLIQAEGIRPVARDGRTGDRPPVLRDMAEPFDSPTNLGAEAFARGPRRAANAPAVLPTEAELTALPEEAAPVTRVRAPADDAPGPLRSERHPAGACPSAAAGQGPFHVLLKGARFHLGSVLYVVADRQPHREQVCCYRVEHGVTALIRLPKAFVYEQLAEPVDMSPLEPVRVS